MFATFDMRTPVLPVAAALLAMGCSSLVFLLPARRPMYPQGKKVMVGQAYSVFPYDVTGAHQSSPPSVEYAGQFNAAPQTDSTLSGDAHFYLPKNANLYGGFVPPTGYATTNGSVGPYDDRYYQRFSHVTSLDPAHGTSSLDWGQAQLSSFRPPSGESYQNPNVNQDFAYRWPTADAKRFNGRPVVGTASALYPSATAAEDQSANASSQRMFSSQPVAAAVQRSPTAHAHDATVYYGWEQQSIAGSLALHSHPIAHGMGGSVMYPPASSPGVYDHGLMAENSFGMGMLDGVPQSDQALSERLPSADIPQAASSVGVDAAPGPRRRGRDEAAIARRRKVPGQFICSHCTTATFTTKAARDKHIESSHLNTVYRCGIDGCTKTYAHQASLDRHRRDTHDTSKKRYGGAVD